MNVISQILLTCLNTTHCLFLNSLAELEKDMAALRTGLKEVERELEFHRSQTQPTANNVPADRFLPVMKEFLSSATCRFSELEDLFQDMKTRVSLTTFANKTN